MSEGTPYASLLSIEPGFDRLTLVVGNGAATRTLTTGEGQHFYLFAEVPKEGLDR
jgi:hypothetical protein